METFKNEEEEELRRENGQGNDLEASSSHRDPLIASIRESVGVLSVNLTHSLETLVDQLDYLVKCPQCKIVFEKVPLASKDSRHNEVVKRESGEVVTGVELAHYLENRFRCRNCSTLFCAQCYTSPYHLGYTCKSVRIFLFLFFLLQYLFTNTKNIVFR